MKMEGEGDIFYARYTHPQHAGEGYVDARVKTKKGTEIENIHHPQARCANVPLLTHEVQQSGIPFNRKNPPKRSEPSKPNPPEPSLPSPFTPHLSSPSPPLLPPPLPHPPNLSSTDFKPYHPSRTLFPRRWQITLSYCMKRRSTMFACFAKIFFCFGGISFSNPFSFKILQNFQNAEDCSIREF